MHNVPVAPTQCDVQNFLSKKCDGAFVDFNEQTLYIFKKCLDILWINFNLTFPSLDGLKKLLRFHVSFFAVHG